MRTTITQVLRHVHEMPAAYDNAVLVEFSDGSKVSFSRAGLGTRVALWNGERMLSFYFAEENEVLVWCQAFMGGMI
jgi:hypothetical protein